jgi:hypothetical protein
MDLAKVLTVLSGLKTLLQIAEKKNDGSELIDDLIHQAKVIVNQIDLLKQNNIISEQELEVQLLQEVFDSLRLFFDSYSQNSLVQNFSNYVYAAKYYEELKTIEKKMSRLYNQLKLKVQILTGMDISIVRTLNKLGLISDGKKINSLL